MSNTLTCLRCHRETEALATAPMPGPTGLEIQQRICPKCWAEWQQMEVMVINELRLNFMDPGAQAALDRHMREFLALPALDEEAT